MKWGGFGGVFIEDVLGSSGEELTGEVAFCRVGWFRVCIGLPRGSAVSVRAQHIVGEVQKCHFGGQEATVRFLVGDRVADG